MSPPPPSNGPELHEKERFEVGLPADRDRQDRRDNDEH